MDRIDAMRVFLATLDEGSLSAGARRTGRSPAAASRAIVFLEQHLGAELFHRNTRALKPSGAGERFAAACRRILMELDDAEAAAGDERLTPRGMLTITASVAAGDEVLRPIIDAFMSAYPEVSVRLHLFERPANLVREGMDLALRIAHLADSNLVAVRLGEIRHLVVAAPGYLARHDPIEAVADLTRHQIIAMTHLGTESWGFSPAEGSGGSRVVHFSPRFLVNSIRSAVASAIAGNGVTRVASYHVADQIAQGKLKVLLPHDELPPMPVHLVAPPGRMQVPKVRAFVDFAVPRLRASFRRFAEVDGMPTESEAAAACEAAQP
jgi:DNA-binding transcriptional LysR family regulator